MLAYIFAQACDVPSKKTVRQREGGEIAFLLGNYRAQREGPRFQRLQCLPREKGVTAQTGDAAAPIETAQSQKQTPRPQRDSYKANSSVSEESVQLLLFRAVKLSGSKNLLNRHSG